MAFAESPPPFHRPAASPALRRWRLGAAAANSAVATIAADVQSRLPRLPEPMLGRPRLLDRLNEWAPVTVVQAITGTGKTTLVAEWLAAAHAETVVPIWLGRAGQLGGSCVSAVPPSNSAVSAEFDQQLSRVLDSAGIGPAGPGATTAALARLRDELLRAPGDRRIVLVLDGVDHLVDTATARLLVELVQQHRGLHLVVCSTGTHPFETVAAASVTVNTITSRDLMLSIDELAELAQLLDRSLPSPMLAQLHDATGGWLTVSRLILEAMTGADRELPRAAAAGYLNQVLINAQVVIDAQTGAEASAADHDEVLRLSLADHLDDALIGDILGTDAARAAIAGLERSGLVERRYRGDLVVYEYPTLIREVLRAGSVDRDPVAARAFHARLATWYARRDRRDYDLPALRHAVAAGEWTLAIQIWNRHGLALAAVDAVRVRAIVRDIPRPVIDEHPALRVYASGAALVNHQVDGPSVARRHHEQCLRLGNGQLAAMPLADLLYLAAGKLAAARAAAAVHGFGPDDDGDPDELGSLVDRVRIEIATNRDAAVLGERVAWFQLQVASSAMLAGSRDEALRQYQQAVENAVAAGADFVVCRAAAELALVHAMSGEPQVARRWLRQRDDAIAGGRCNPADGQVAASVAVGLLALDQLDEAAVDAELARLDTLTGADEMWPFVAYLNCQHALHYGEPATMLTRLAAWQRGRLGASGQLTGYPGELLARARADLLISLGQGQRAQSVIGSVPDPGPLLSVPVARLCLLSGDYEQARLRATRAMFDDATGVRDQVELRLIHATAALRAGDGAAAGQLVREALASSLEHGIVRAFATIAAVDLAELARLAGGRADQPGLTDHLIAGPRAGRAPIYADRLVLISLTKSERELIEALERTGSRREIAETRYVSLNTVKTQLRALYHKLGTSTREDTLTKIRELGLLA